MNSISITNSKLSEFNYFPHYDRSVFPVLEPGKKYCFYDLRVGNQQYKGDCTVALGSTSTTTIKVKIKMFISVDCKYISERYN